MHRIALLVACSLAVGCEMLETAPRKGVAYPFDMEKYEVGYQAGNDLQQVVEFVPVGEQVESWSELVTMITLNKRALNLPTSRQMMESIRSDMTSQCPGLTWKVIEETPGSILYEWWVGGCTAMDDQHEVARILQSDWNGYHLKYTVKGPRMTPTQRDEWVQTLSSAQITTF